MKDKTTVELIIEKPSPENNFRWYYAICVPEANYGVLYDGYQYSKEDIFTVARISMNRALNEIQMEENENKDSR